MTDSFVTNTEDTYPAPIRLLDCTLRDGSYAVGFQFTEQAIGDILTGLEAAGVMYVELGHGLGLGAGDVKDPMRVPEEQCFKIAGSCLRDSAWGMFCIPGIASLDRLREAAAAGMRFVRVGVDITEVSPAAEFLAAARDLGLETFANLMKTNVLDTAGVVAAVRQCEDYGADAVYLVDSVGGFLPHEVAELFTAVGAASDLPLGFHGHDNLGLANANALAAVQSGAVFVDATLDGLGRAAGNTATERFAAILRRLGRGDGYDCLALSQLSERVVRPLTRLPDDRAFQVMGGLTQTHSSHFPLIIRCARTHGVDVFDLMAAVSRIDPVSPSESLVLGTAARLAEAR
ncbi:hypothetical protein [Catellatospora tritici]|uniref:hypothetical protein n=1 Tax=Catellatospora tritici TaxID=2851566 RepID=UPI001C2DBF0A|nr:hypothetical protein [Catellatospora tritici]MBV1849575.1 hypothetical protein [Catellatospora tritici]